MAITPTALRTAFLLRSLKRSTGSASTRAACSTIAARRWSLGKTTPMLRFPLLISSKGYGLMWNTAALT